MQSDRGWHRSMNKCVWPEERETINNRAGCTREIERTRFPSFLFCVAAKCTYLIKKTLVPSRHRAFVLPLQSSGGQGSAGDIFPLRKRVVAFAGPSLWQSSSGHLTRAAAFGLINHCDARATLCVALFHSHALCFSC